MRAGLHGIDFFDAQLEHDAGEATRGQPEGGLPTGGQPDVEFVPHPDPVEALAEEVQRLKGAVRALAWIVTILLATYLPLSAALLWAVS